MRNFDLMMRLYTDDEIEKLEYDVSLFLDTFSENEEMLKKALDFVKLRSDLCFNCSFIPRGRFMEISNELLIEALIKEILRISFNLCQLIYFVYKKIVDFSIICFERGRIL